MSATLSNLPRMAYVVVDHIGNPCFSSDTFERAGERLLALLRGECESYPQATNVPLFKIVRVEAE